MARELDQHGPDAAGRAQHHDRLAPLHGGGAVQHPPRGEAVDDGGLGGKRVEPVGERDQPTDHPHRYRLVFSSAYGSGRLAPERTIPAAHRSMVTFLEAIAALRRASDEATAPRTALQRQLERWAADRAGDGEARLPAAVLHLGTVAWTRLHGVVSLEIEGSFASMDVDPALLYASEVQQLVAQVGATTPARRRARPAPAA